MFGYEVLGKLRCNVLLILSENWKYHQKMKSRHCNFLWRKIASAVSWVSVCCAVLGTNLGAYLPSIIMTGMLTYFKEKGSEESV